MIGDQLRNKMILRGHPSCADTGKCLQTAAEKGVDVDVVVVTDVDASDFRETIKASAHRWYRATV